MLKPELQQKGPGINYLVPKNKQKLSKITQGPDELFQDFVSRLMTTTERQLEDSEAELLIVKQLAYESANSACQATIRPFRKKGNISNYIQLCSDIGPSYMQGLASAATSQKKKKTVKDMLSQQRKQQTFSRGEGGGRKQNLVLLMAIGYKL